MMETNPIGLYVHIPFCKKKCNYCDFCSEAACDIKIDRYISSLIGEIRSYKRSDPIKINSIFFGGGTPSYISADSFSSVVDAIRESFDIADGTEFSIEMNPGTVDIDKINSYKRCGVNRASIGLQSIHEKEMKKLGRIHNFDEFVYAYNMVKEHLTTNINVDLMFGIPYQTKESFSKTLDTVMILDPAHISCYGLIIEEGTPFSLQEKELDLPSEDDEFYMYCMADKLLTDYGYEHYEISNFAKSGKRCTHNLKYWKDEEYIGVGLAAHSYYEGKRFSNTSSFDEYFDSYGEKYRRIESVTDGKDSFEYVMLALRLSDGFSLSEYERLFKKSFILGKEKLISEYAARGLLLIDGDRIKLSAEGFYLSNTILTALLDFPS